MKNIILDLRGLSCPQPVFETKKAIEDPKFGSITILVDSKTSLENIKRLLTNRKDLQFSVKKEDDYAVTIIRP
jgi:tRNA 2-thiouridine synthesizing protein A